jgi:hypothetical protein
LFISPFSPILGRAGYWVKRDILQVLDTSYEWLAMTKQFLLFAELYPVTNTVSLEK